MNRRLTWTLCAVIGASALGAAHGQAPDCDPATRACFDIRVDLPIAAEPSPREGYERPTVNRYQNQELEIYRQLRMDQTPYTCATIGGEEGLSNREEEEGTDVEHIVALAEAHDSGLSADDMVTFSGDPFNLTVAMPYENRTVKSDRDAADYLPQHNQCWFAARVIAVKQRWGLSVDEREAQFLKTALAGCTPEQIARPVCEASETTTTTGGSAEAWLARCDANSNGRVRRGASSDVRSADPGDQRSPPVPVHDRRRRRWAGLRVTSKSTYSPGKDKRRSTKPVDTDQR